MTSADALLELFVEVGNAVRRAVEAIPPSALRDRTETAGQYALDLVADAEACRVLDRASVRIVSEESGVHERAGATVTVVLDPVDGSTNCSRRIPYWATSICALDADGALAGLVVNQVTGVAVTAVRGAGAHRDGVPIHASAATRVDQSMVYLTGAPGTALAWKQSRSLGSVALGLCEVATGSFDGLLDAGGFHAPWDYLAGYLACIEAGAVVRDAQGRDLVTDDFDARRQLIAAGTSELADTLAGGLV